MSNTLASFKMIRMILPSLPSKNLDSKIPLTMRFKASVLAKSIAPNPSSFASNKFNSTAALKISTNLMISSTNSFDP